MAPLASRSCLEKNEGADALAAYLEDAAGGAGGVNHFRAVGVEVDHGLLAVDVFAGAHGVYAGLLVPMVGGADDDRVDVAASQDLAVIAGGKNVVAPHLLAVDEAPVIAIRHGNQLDAGNLERDGRIALALAAGSDERNLNMVVRRHRPRCLACDGGQRMQPRAQQCGRCRRSCRS